jgi:pyrroline-5-carboxylate reductase
MSSARIPRLAIIGGGTMGQAMLCGLLHENAVSPDEVAVGEPGAERRAQLSTEHGVSTTANNLEAVRGASVVLLAVKPQVVPEVLQELHGHIDPGAVVVSIVAGLSIRRIQDDLNHPSVVRGMPNTPARVSHGVTVWCAAQPVDDLQRTRAAAIFAASGEALEVKGEALVEAATGLTAPTPAFAFLIVEALVEAGVAMGFDHRTAGLLVRETLAGSMELLKQTGEHPAVLRSQVTSPGGATAAGLAVLEEASLRARLAEAVRAVAARSSELARDDSKE